MYRAIHVARDALLRFPSVSSLVSLQVQWATAWFVNFSIFFLMCWFSLTYAMLLGAKATDEWLMALLQGFWFGTAVLEPIEVAASSREYEASLPTSCFLLPTLLGRSCLLTLTSPISHH